MKCLHCGSADVKEHRVDRHSMTRLYCKECRKYSKKFGAPKILLLDIESSKGVFRIYRTGKQYVSWKNIEKEPYVTGWAAKWLFDSEMHSCFVRPAEAKKRNERRVVKELYQLMNQADMIITHNGDKFDLRQLNMRFIKYGLMPNNRYLSVDTLKKAKQILDAQSYSLEYLLQYYNLSPKMERGDTDAAEDGDKVALLEDEKYCRQDVWGLEELYLLLRGWMKTHPNMSVYYEMYHPLGEGENYCPRCLHVVTRFKFTRFWRTPQGTLYRSGNCPHCGAVLRKARKYKKRKVK